MRDEKYEQEMKVQKADQRIFELQRTDQQMERLLKNTARSASGITEIKQNR